MAGSFADATTVVRLDEESGGTDGDTSSWSGAVRPDWDIAGNANGGYLLAIAARALVAATGRPDPVTTTAHYLAPAPVGDVQLRTAVVRRGGRFTTATATMSMGPRPLLSVVSTLGDLSQMQGPELIDGGPPDLPAPDACAPLEPTETMPPPFAGRVEIRLHPEDAGFRTRGPSGRALMRGWFRLPGGETVDSIGVLLAADSFPPTAFNARLPMAWVPTIELTAHLRARPVAGWLACRFSTRFVSGGFLEEDGEIWDASGRLVAQSRQLALVPRPS